jgi:O-antigen/teichoic acid export membrane protein
VSRLLGRLVGIVLVVLLARRASTDTVAVYGYLLGTATLVATLTDLGVAAVAGREVAAGRLPAGGALRAALAPHAASLAAAAAATVLLTVVAGPAAVPPGALALTVAYVVVAGFVNLWADILRGAGKVLLEGGLQVASAVALVIGGVIVVEVGGDATDLLLVVLGKELAVLVIMAAMVRPVRDARASGRLLLGQSVWLAVAGTALVLLWRQGTLVIGAIGTTGALAAYVVASRFLDAGVTIAHTAGFGLMPGASALATDRAAFRRAARRFLGLATLVGVLVGVVGALVARPITVVPFGERWADVVPAVRWIAISALPILLVFVAWSLLLARGQVRTLAFGSTGGTVVGMATSIVLVAHDPQPLAAVLGTLVGATVTAVVLLVGLRDVLVGPAPAESAGDGHRARHAAAE